MSCSSPRSLSLLTLDKIERVDAFSFAKLEFTLDLLDAIPNGGIDPRCSLEDRALGKLPDRLELPEVEPSALDAFCCEDPGSLDKGIIIEVEFPRRKGGGGGMPLSLNTLEIGDCIPSAPDTKAVDALRRKTGGERARFGNGDIARRPLGFSGEDMGDWGTRIGIGAGIAIGTAGLCAREGECTAAGATPTTTLAAPGTPTMGCGEVMYCLGGESIHGLVGATGRRGRFAPGMIGDPG